MTRYLDRDSLTRGDVDTYLKALDIQYDSDVLPASYKAGDVILAGPLNRWRWLPSAVQLEIVPDGTRPKRDTPLEYALRVRGLKKDLIKKPPSQRSKFYVPYMEAKAWADEVSKDYAPIKVGEAAIECKLVTEAEDIQRLFNTLQSSPLFSFDYETDPSGGLYSVGLADEHNTWYCVGPGFQESIPQLIELIKHRDGDAIVHRAEFEYQVTCAATEWGLEPTDIARPLLDTNTMHWVLTCGTRASNALKPMSRSILGRDVLDFEDIAPDGDITKVPWDLQAQYAGVGDARNTYDMFPIIQRRLIDADLWDVYNLIERPLTPVLVEMNHTGLDLDLDVVNELIDKYYLETRRLEQLIKDQGFPGNNIYSPDQIAAWWYDDLGLPIYKRTESGKRGMVDDKARLRLMGLHPSVEAYDQLQKANKLLTAFLVPVANKGVPHTTVSFQQTSTTTGRLSARQPNPQQWPVSVRDMVVAPPGHIYYARDYSQIEPRIIAMASGDSGMVEAYRAGQDAYLNVAHDLGFSEDNYRNPRMPTKRIVKATFLGWLYGQGGVGMQQTVAEEGIKLTLQECNDYARKLAEARPGLSKWRRDVLDYTRQTGGSRTLFGRRRLIPNILARDPSVRGRSEREAVNVVPQGTSADLIKMVMPSVHRLVKSQGGRNRLQVHDELAGTWSHEAEAKMGSLLDSLMAEGNRLSQVVDEARLVPLKVGTEIGRSWGDAHKE